MSHRKIEKDPDLERRGGYEKMEKSGELQEALFEALETLKEQGHDLGAKFDRVQEKRRKLKKRTKRRNRRQNK